MTHDHHHVSVPAAYSAVTYTHHHISIPAESPTTTHSHHQGGGGGHHHHHHHGHHHHDDDSQQQRAALPGFPVPYADPSPALASTRVGAAVLEPTTDDDDDCCDADDRFRAVWCAITVIVIVVGILLYVFVFNRR
ncbi:histidine-rich glycoprotein [Triticum aestivum]|uniref:histidine-rich glycoprotein n=1 Tax=Triticum aestivum TaxID=4565 RepID=UPI001D027182|nr:histidine-rich glycoprotein-like [Triticum aestivum]